MQSGGRLRRAVSRGGNGTAAASLRKRDDCKEGRRVLPNIPIFFPSRVRFRSMEIAREAAKYFLFDRGLIASA